MKVQIEISTELDTLIKSLGLPMNKAQSINLILVRWALEKGNALAQEAHQRYPGADTLSQSSRGTWVLQQLFGAPEHG